MGTITIGISKNDLCSDIQSDFSQKLGFGKNPSINIKSRSELKLDKKHSQMIKDGYDLHTYGFVKDRFIFIASNPNPFYYKLHDYRVTIHLSQWNNIKEVIDVFCEIFGSLNTQRIFNRGDVLRLDAWLDTEWSYDFLKQSVYRKGVSVSEQVKSDRKTYYMGSKKPTPALFYEKKDLNKKWIDVGISKGVKSKTTTRIEVRFFSPKVPINHFSEYLELAEKDLFEKLSTSHIQNDKLKLLYPLITRKKLVWFQLFIVEVRKEGIHSARRTFNKQRDFSRTIQPLLDKCTVDLELSKKWKHKVRTRLVDNLDLKKYLESKQKMKIQIKLDHNTCRKLRLVWKR